MNRKHLHIVSFSLSFLLLLSVTENTLAQTNRWLWLSTGTAPNSQGTEYTAAPNVPSGAYVPAPRQNAAAAADTAGNLWLYGGGISTPQSKLWRYNTVTSEWTWLTGSSSDTAPSGRNYATSWIDNNGNFWLFGGSEGPVQPSHYDLWKFDIVANKWIQVTTEKPFGEGVYGTQGVPSSDNHPGLRFGSVGWKDDEGNLWLFGGYGYGILASSRSIGALNDVWKYNIATNQWTWMGGNLYAGDQGSYGKQGVSSPNNIPGARYGAVAQTDGKGTVWMYGNSYSTLNDLWKFDIATNIWTWIKGDTTVNPDGNNGVYGTKGIPADTNTPGYRYGMCSFVDASGNFWMFGGRTTRYQNTNPYIGFFNDLWKFDISTNQWVWTDGDSTTDAVRMYNADGASDPGGRLGMAGWTDNKGQFWMFGGFTQTADGSFALLNDLWSYTSSQVLPVTLLSFTGSVSNKSVMLNWITSQSVNNKGFEVQKSEDGQTYSDVGFVPYTGLNRYTFIDANLSSGTSLYRLKIVDINGSYTYSPVINLDYSSFSWNVINNTSDAYLQLQLDKAASVSVQVITLSGTLIQSVNKGKLDMGSYSIPLSLHKASSGLYIIRLMMNEKSYSKKILINR